MSCYLICQCLILLKSLGQKFLHFAQKIEACNNLASCRDCIITHVIVWVAGPIPNVSLPNEAQDLELHFYFTEALWKLIRGVIDVIFVNLATHFIFPQYNLVAGTLVAGTYRCLHREICIFATVDVEVQCFPSDVIGPWRKMRKCWTFLI